jgi:anti-anti-sigma factor
MIVQTNRRQVDPDITVIEVSGRIRLGTSAQSLEWELQSLIKDGVRKLVLDISQLHSIDSAGIGMFCMIAGEMTKCGGCLRIAGAQGLVANTFDLVHMDKIVPQFSDTPSACQGFPG